jgi:hypothetical protein
MFDPNKQITACELSMSHFPGCPVNFIQPGKLARLTREAPWGKDVNSNGIRQASVENVDKL